MSTHLVTMSHKLQSFLRGHHHPILLDWLDLRMHSGLDEAAADGEVKVNRDAFRAGGGSNVDFDRYDLNQASGHG
jgi:hypothetical protein